MMNSGVHSEEEDDGDIGDISSNSSVPSLHISNDDLDLMQFNYISQPLSEVFDADPPNLSDVLRNDPILTQAGAHGDEVCCDWDNDPAPGQLKTNKRNRSLEEIGKFHNKQKHNSNSSQISDISPQSPSASCTYLGFRDTEIWQGHGTDAKTPPMPSKFPDQHKQEKPTPVFVPETAVDSCSSLVRPNFNLPQSLNFETGTNAVRHFVDTEIQSNVHTSQSPSKIIDRCNNEIHSDLIASTPNHDSSLANKPKTKNVTHQ